MMHEFADIIKHLEDAEMGLDDLIFETLKEQMSTMDSESAKEVEKRLAKSKRSVVKAIAVLKGVEFNSLGD
jgi:hypothetical protein